MEFGNLKLVGAEPASSSIEKDFTSLRVPDSSEPISFPGIKERGVTEATVRKLMVAIAEHKLDLGSCILKGGSWRVAALRHMGIVPGGTPPGALIQQALHDLSREIEEIPLLSGLANQSVEWRNTISQIRKVLKDPTRDVRRDPLLGELYEALVTDEEPPACREGSPDLKLVE